MWSGKDAADQMQTWHIEGKTNVQGLCLKTCRLAWKLPAKYPSATSTAIIICASISISSTPVSLNRQAMRTTLVFSVML